MGKSVNIQLSKFETLQLFNDGERIHVIRINESGESACGNLSQEQINGLIELLQHCNHEKKEYMNTLWDNEEIATCEDCGEEVI